MSNTPMLIATVVNIMRDAVHFADPVHAKRLCEIAHAENNVIFMIP